MVRACGSKQHRRAKLRLFGRRPPLSLGDPNPGFSGRQYVREAGGHRCGRRCRQRHDDIVEALVAKASTLTVGNPTDVSTFFGPQVSAAQQARVTGRIASGIEQGARLVMGGLGMPKGLRTGHFVRPTIFAHVDNRMEIARRAIFGPVMSVIPYDDVEDALQITNDSDYGLFGAVWTNDAAVGLDIARRVRAGTIKVNAARQDFLAPFGGIKQSGLGRTFGSSGMDDYTAHKSIWV